MKMFKMLCLTAAVAILPCLAQADNLFKMSWRGTVYTVGPLGTVVAHSFTEKDFINKVAADNNGLDPKTLAFVYRADKRDTAVVRLSDGMFIADVIQMENSYTDVSNTAQTQIVRQVFLFDEAHPDALGSAFGTEKRKVDGLGNLTSFSFKGTFQYNLDGKVYSGTFSAGKRVNDLTGS